VLAPARAAARRGEGAVRAPARSYAECSVARAGARAAGPVGRRWGVRCTAGGWWQVISYAWLHGPTYPLALPNLPCPRLLPQSPKQASSRLPKAPRQRNGPGKKQRNRQQTHTKQLKPPKRSRRCADGSSIGAIITSNFN
jgi:hypothetical protein